MELLPQDMILHIATFIKREYIFDREYFVIVKYYPIQVLYATCKAFHWLSKLEYIFIESICGISQYNIVLCNINGAPSMLFKVKTGNIVGYKNYNNNTHCGVNYWNYRHDDKIQQAVLDQDPQLKTIIGQYDNDVVIIRDKIDREYQLNNYTL